MKRCLIAGLLVTTLTACGGSGTPPETAAERGQSFINLSNQYRATPTAPSLPTSGSAFYGGQMAMVVENRTNTADSVIIGDMDMSVMFASRNVTGSVRNMVNGDDGVITPVGGQLSLTGSTTGNNGLRVDVSGPITLYGTTSDLDFEMTGQFRGTGGTPSMVSGRKNLFPFSLSGTQREITQAEFYGKLK